MKRRWTRILLVGRSPRTAADAPSVHAMGAEAANVHLGSRRQIAHILKDLSKRKSDWLRSAARSMAQAVVVEWKEYKET